MFGNNAIKVPIKSCLHGFDMYVTIIVSLSPLQNNQVCVYKYTVTQDEVEDDTWMNATVTTTVEVSCDTGESSL